MIDTFYLHLEFKNKKSNWSINLPFLCIKCGVCCKLEDFLVAGEISAKPKEQPQTYAKVTALFEELGKKWEADEGKYDEYIAQVSCPFLVNNNCSIYKIRPLGCQLFPKTTFGMQTKDCPSLNRFKKQRHSLKKGKNCKETYNFIETKGSIISGEPIKSTKLTEKQYQACIAKLHKAGITESELALLNDFNRKSKNKNA
jgi:Fe-S-cluster containining protein